MKEENRPNYVVNFKNSKLYADGFNPSDLVGLRTNFDDTMRVRTCAYPKSRWVKKFLDEHEVMFEREISSKKTRITKDGAWIGKEIKDEDAVLDVLLKLSEFFYNVLGSGIFDIKPSGKKEEQMKGKSKQKKEAKKPATKKKK